MNERKQVSLPDFLTMEEIETCLKLYLDMNNARSHGYAAIICERIIKPNIARINKSLDQENDPMFLAYAVEYVMMQFCPEE